MAERVLRHTETVRDVLRAQTHDAHEQLHHHSTFVALFKQNLALEDYCMLLRRHHGFYVPLERAILAVIGDLPSQSAAFSYESRVQHLAQDLLDLGFSDAAILDGPQCMQVFDVVTPKTLGGVLYVIEGSTLGAAPIDRAAQKLLSSDALNGRRFWAWSRAQNKHRWAITNQYLEALSAEGASLDDLAAGANLTFQALADWLAPLDQAIHTEQGLQL